MSKQDRLPLRKIIYFSWFLLLTLWLGSWLVFNLEVAWGVLSGGLIANFSFILLKRDITRLLQGELTSVKASFFIKYYVRLAVIAIMLFVIIKFQAVHLLGLLTGLSTIFVSVTAVTIRNAGKELNIKEAS